MKSTKAATRIDRKLDFPSVNFAMPSLIISKIELGGKNEIGILLDLLDISVSILCQSIILKH